MVTLVAGYGIGVGVCCVAWPQTRPDWRIALRLTAMPVPWRIAGVLGITAGMVGFIISMNMTYGATILLEFATAPFWAAWIARVCRGQRLENATIAAMVVTAAGVTILAVDGWMNASEGDAAELINAQHRPVQGASLGMMGTIGYALYTVALRTIDGTATAKTGVSLTLWAALLMVIGSSIAMLVRAGGADSGPLATPGTNIWLSVGHGIALLTGFACYSAGARFLPAAEAVLLSMLEIVVGILFAVFFIGEIPTPLGALGCSMTGLAVGWHGVAACRQGMVQEAGGAAVTTVSADTDAGVFASAMRVSDDGGGPLTGKQQLTTV